jgi:hypothetical protein
MRTSLGWLVAGICLIISAAIIGSAYTYKYRSQDRIVVTGLGENEFESDLIVWNGVVVEQSPTAAEGYAKLKVSQEKVQKFIHDKGIPDDAVVFMFVNVSEVNESLYSSDGRYIGSKLKGYELRQQFTVESKDVELVESTSREISSLIAQGVQIDSWQPDYYYTKLDNLKLELIDKASEDARLRAEKIAGQSKSNLGALANARMGVFQITGANTNEEFSAGGSFNTANRFKKARVTMRIEYKIK